MVDLGVLPGFVAVTMLFLIPPGPDMTYMLAVGLEGGRRAALRAITGIGTGMSVYAAAVVVGVGAFAQANPLLLDVVTTIGAGYLLWLARTALRRAPDRTDGPREMAAGRWYRRGLLISLSNPKIMLFFLAVLPGFTGSAQSTVLQMAVLGAVNVATEVVLYGGIGVLAGGLRSRFRGAPRASTALRRMTGAVYAALATVIAAGVFLG